MPYQVYLLYSPEFQKTYVGYTSNLEERLKSHNELGHHICKNPCLIRGIRVPTRYDEQRKLTRRRLAGHGFHG